MMHIPVARRVLYLHYQAADAGLWPEISGSTQRSWRADEPAGWLDVLNMSQTLHTHTQRERERERTPVLTARRCHMRVRPTGAVLRTTTTNRPHPPEFHIPHAGAANDHLHSFPGNGLGVYSDTKQDCPEPEYGLERRHLLA